MYLLEAALIRAVLFLFVSFRIEGRENVPAHGALLVVCNHLSVADPPILGVSLKRRTRFMAKEELFRNIFFRFAVTQFGAFPVYRGSSGRQALRRAHEVLEKGNALVMFPEGQRSRTGRLGPGMPGAALVAYHNRCMILPVGIEGTEVIKGLRWLVKRPEVCLKIGKPFRLSEDSRSLSREQLQVHCDRIMTEISQLVAERYRSH